MHKLNRPGEPQALVECRHTFQHWSELSGEHREPIRNALHKMQTGWCAYCGCQISANNQDSHIEHFRKQALFPAFVFQWSNLFLSCCVENTCGKHKDKIIETDDYAIILDPTLDDPEDFLKFVFNGEVVPVESLSDADKRRASRTIELFNLNHPALKDSRRNVIKAVFKYDLPPSEMHYYPHPVAISHAKNRRFR